MMGSPKGETGRNEEEEQHEVEITRAFYLGKYEVTQKQYRAITGTNPSWFFAEGEGKKEVEGINSDDFPVENVTWEEAEIFCKKLNGKDRKKPWGWLYRLPTEAEWEYCCRGGAASSPFHCGRSLSSTQANCNGAPPIGEVNWGSRPKRTCKVGSYKPNGYGLYDMHGNVREWCLDWYHKDYYGKSDKTNPEGPSISDFERTGDFSKVTRGGGWRSSDVYCRSASRQKAWYGPRRRLGVPCRPGSIQVKPAWSPRSL
jgi:formylglycine-generating enzyme required for sulfatase activity